MLGLYAVAAAALLLPALVNGFPLVMGDTWRYIREADGHYSWASSHFYGYLLRILEGTSLWLVIALQAGAAIYVLSAFFRRVLGAPHAHAAAATALVALTSSVAFFASLVMTDIVLGLGLVAAATLLLAPAWRWSDLPLLLVVAFATAAHPVALPLFVLLVVAALVPLIGTRARRGRWSRLPGVTAIAGAVAAGVVALTISNAIVWGKPTPNPHSSVATFAYLYYHGDLDQQLAECARWDVCALPQTAPRHPDRRRLFDFGSRDLSEFNWFLFDGDTSVLWKELGGPTEFAGTARAIVVDHVTSQPAAYAGRVGSTAWEQLFQVRALEHLEWMTRYLGERHSALLETHNGGDPPRFEAGRQFRETLDLDWAADIAVAFAVLGAVATGTAALVFAGLAMARRPRLGEPLSTAVGASLLLLALYAAHALVVATSTYPTPRYGGRVSWLLVLGLWALAYATVRAYGVPGALGRLPKPRVHEDDVAEPADGNADVADTRRAAREPRERR